ATPASERATTTESVLSSGSVKRVDSASPNQGKREVPVMSATNPTTPGPEFPGSYPKELDIQEPQASKESTSGSNSHSLPTGASVLHTAKQYMPKKVEQTVEYASQTAATYLPIPQTIKDSVDAPQEHIISMPSTELTGAQPSEHSGGVGALPGNISETSLAVLPAER
ncbi:hypothetical protein BU15DRAFT_31056, partial [Melanogaster broomeanus]